MFLFSTPSPANFALFSANFAVSVLLMGFLVMLLLVIFKILILIGGLSHEKTVSLLLIVILAFSCFAMTAGAQTDTATKAPMGNTSGNISNSGYVAESGGWIYYYDESSWNITRINAQNQKQAIVEGVMPAYINVVGDWIYYVNAGGSGQANLGIHKVKTDGTGKQFIVKHVIKNKASAGMGGMFVQDDWIYFSEAVPENNNSVSSSIYRVKTDGTGRKKIIDGASQFALDGNCIYYITYPFDTGSKLYTAKTDGTDNKKIIDDYVKDLLVDGNWIYYASGYNIYRMKKDGTGKTLITDDSFPDFFNVDGNWVYYKNINDQNLYRIKTDGTNKKMILKDSTATQINLTKDWLYYWSVLEKNDFKRIARAKIDK